MIHDLRSVTNGGQGSMSCNLAGCTGKCGICTPPQPEPPPDHADFIALRRGGFKALRREMAKRKRAK